MCEPTNSLKDYLAGKTPQTHSDDATKITAQTKKELKTLAENSSRFCKDPSLENMIAISRFTSDIDKKTCIISSWDFKQRLSRDYAGNWSVIPERAGLCDIIQLDRFERATGGTGNSMTFWNYVARRTVANRDVKKNPMCDVEETEHKYSWMSKAIDMDCQHIEFGF